MPTLTHCSRILSKSTRVSKRASLPRAVEFAREFFRDWERLTHSGRYDMNRLKAVMLLLVANDAPLPPEWLDHALTGEWANHRECHAGGDFLLIYRLAVNGKRKSETVYFTRTGTHADLFE